MGWIGGFRSKVWCAGVTVVDDYGHHPTEIVATLRAARDCGYGRVHVLFQPAPVHADAGFDGGVCYGV